MPHATHTCGRPHAGRREKGGRRHANSPHGESERLQCNATKCNKLRHTTTHCNTLQHTASYHNALQHKRWTGSDRASQRKNTRKCVCMCVRKGVCVCLCALERASTCKSVRECVGQQENESRNVRKQKKKKERKISSGWYHSVGERLRARARARASEGERAREKRRERVSDCERESERGQITLFTFAAYVLAREHYIWFKNVLWNDTEKVFSLHIYTNTYIHKNM